MSPSATSNGGPPPPLRMIPLSYDSANSETSARALIFALNPDWETSPGDVEFVRFKEGITNTLFKAIKKRPSYSDQQIDAEAVLLRAYGNGTAVLIDREQEALSHSLLSKHHLAPPLLARFGNGLLYRFIQGVACTPADLRRPEVWRATARHLGRWHGTMPTAELAAKSAPVNGLGERQHETMTESLMGKPVPNVWTVMQKWIISLPSKSKAEQERNIALQKELQYSTKLLANTVGLSSGEYVLGHCDLLSGNVIIHPKSKKSRCDDTEEVSFIDYEYATPAPAAFDLANHFAEWGGFECEYEVLPTRSQRREFLQHYAESYRSHSEPKTNLSSGNRHAIVNLEDDVEQLMEEVDAFRGIPGLYWGIWALIQATISQIDFDYASYADIRLGEYWAWKAEIDGSRELSGGEMPIRERRLAQES